MVETRQTCSDERAAPSLSCYPEYPPSDNPFKQLFVDVTYRCNMHCKNCYVRTGEHRRPDPDTTWLLDLISRFPSRTQIRMLGGEPTLRHDLPVLIRETRRMGHTPVLLTNGLRLTEPGYASVLRQAGLRSVHLSMNGGTDDDLYARMDGQRCAAAKQAALHAMAAAGFRISVGMILIPGVNTEHLPSFLAYLRAVPSVREIKIRSVGPYGRHVEDRRLDMSAMIDLCSDACGIPPSTIRRGLVRPTLCAFEWADRRVQLTEWPDLNSTRRGYLTRQGTVVPFFEYLVHSGSV